MKKTMRYPSCMKLGNEETTDMQAKSELFAEYFKDVFVKDDLLPR
ncbi:hypothetical protein Bhyg_02328 [Pseudolycoriella hygida]|uniref:Uncharacterized protein n=1 Tax=Pseudolycoriella hygida TaxID=35572 RepID=A0A9Q0S7N4_9DIPT|nr:hypothetical protein Bhyg_02328 [Pseudolycoriella hygida]